jgi:hypothetical protein
MSGKKKAAAKAKAKAAAQKKKRTSQCGRSERRHNRKSSNEGKL